MDAEQLFRELLDVLSSALKSLPDKPEETPTSCLRALWLAASGHPVSLVSADRVPLPRLDPVQELRLRELVRERLQGRPVAYLTGRQNFLGIDFISTPQALIPRKETELLATFLLECIGQSGVPPAAQVVIDVFTGSGNVPLSLAKLMPGPRYFGSDLSAEAIALARANAAHLGLEEECVFRVGDLLAPFAGAQFTRSVDVISGVPPYISSSKVPLMPKEISDNEPRLAFDAGPLGIGLFMRLIREARTLLKSEGWLCFEVGSGQGPGMLRQLQKHPDYLNARGLADSGGTIRVVAAQRR